MIPTVPELPADIRELKERVSAFLEREVYPLEQRVAEAGRIDPEWASELRRKSWDEGLRDAEHARGERAAAGSRCSARWRSRRNPARPPTALASPSSTAARRSSGTSRRPSSAERFVQPVLQGKYREAWAVTEPGAGSDVSALEATAVRDGDEWGRTAKNGS